MKGQEFDACDMPFYGYYYFKVQEKNKPWGCPFSKHHDHKTGYVSFREHSPMNHGHHHHRPHHRFGPPEDDHRRTGCGRWGPPKRDSDRPSEHHFHGPSGVGAGHGGRPHDFSEHGASSQHFGAQPWWFGRRGPAESQERPWFGPWGGPDHRRS